jgi:hypothetical protein
VEGRVELGDHGQVGHAITTNDVSLDSISLSPVSNTTTDSSYTRAGSYYGLPKIAPLSLKRKSSATVDENDEHEVRSVASQVQFVTHSPRRRSMRPFEDAVVNENGIVSDEESQSVRGLKTMSDVFTDDLEKAAAIELPA